MGLRGCQGSVMLSWRELTGQHPHSAQTAPQRPLPSRRPGSLAAFLSSATAQASAGPTKPLSVPVGVWGGTRGTGSRTRPMRGGGLCGETSGHPSQQAGAKSLLSFRLRAPLGPAPPLKSSGRELRAALRQICAGIINKCVHMWGRAGPTSPLLSPLQGGFVPRTRPPFEPQTPEDPQCGWTLSPMLFLQSF